MVKKLRGSEIAETEAKCAKTVGGPEPLSNQVDPEQGPCHRLPHCPSPGVAVGQTARATSELPARPRQGAVEIDTAFEAVFGALCERAEHDVARLFRQAGVVLVRRVGDISAGGSLGRGFAAGAAGV